jgi:hypothetical protein
MSPQDRANEMLRYWQAQRALKPEERRLPSEDEMRDLEVIRQCLERKI